MFKKLYFLVENIYKITNDKNTMEYKTISA